MRKKALDILILWVLPFPNQNSAPVVYIKTNANRTNKTKYFSGEENNFKELTPFVIQYYAEI